MSLLDPFDSETDLIECALNTEIALVCEDSRNPRRLSAIYSYKLDSEVDPKYLIHGGVFMRMKDAIIPVAKIEMRPLAVSVSYDANTSKLSSATSGRGGFELALSYQTFLERNTTSRNALRCPRF